MIQRLLLFLLVILLFSGCIEIEEKIQINEDQTGHVRYSINTSELGSFLSGLSGLLDKNIEKQLRSEAEKLIQKLKEQPGIKNVNYNIQSADRNYQVSFDFNRAKNFNNALYALGGAKKTIFTPGYLRINRCKVKKINFSGYLSMYLKREQIEIPDQFLSRMLTFKSIVTVPQPIKKVKGSSTLLSEDRSFVSQEFLFTDIIHRKVNTGLKIKLSH
ncbi:MAG: hypothetical protein KQI35_11770 [Bacteroidetes bacterium]|nr:hypothetical protein [Bacteroidota bacterium]